MNRLLLLTFILTIAFTTANANNAIHTSAIFRRRELIPNSTSSRSSFPFLQFSSSNCHRVKCNSLTNLSQLSFLNLRGGATSQSSNGESIQNTSETSNNNTKIDSLAKEADEKTMSELQKDEEIPHVSQTKNDDAQNDPELDPVTNFESPEEDPIHNEAMEETNIFEADSTTDTEADTEADTEVDSYAEGNNVVNDTSEIIITTTTVPTEMNVTSSIPVPVSMSSTLPMLTKAEIDSLREEASDLRAEGKKLHDEGDLEQAATLFDRAASILSKIYNNLSSSSNEDTRRDIADEDFMDEIAQEAATCRLHQALCALKNKEYQTCVDACSSLLLDEDDEKVISSSGTSNSDVTESIITTLAKSTSNPPLSAAVRARAHHRRAKARLGLDDYDRALEDARTAAFLGDRGAVALYGRLMRERGSGYGPGMDGDMMGNPSDTLGSLFGNTGNGGIGDNPFAQLQSLMGSSSDGDSSSPFGGGLLSGNSPFGGLGGLGPLASMLNPNSSSKNNDKDSNSIVQSVLSTVTDKIQSEETQTKICSFLNSATESQISTFASMANVPLTSKQISQIVKFSNSMTVSKMQKSVNLTKRGISAFKMIRKVSKIIGKYKFVLVYLMVLQWVKSALNRPIVVKLKKK